MADMRRLYEVDLTTTLFVVAESEDDAEWIARGVAHSELSSDEFDANARLVRANAKLAPDWANALPWGDIEDDERTCAEWLAASSDTDEERP